MGHAQSPISSVMHTSHYRTLDEPDGSGRRCVAFLNEVDWREEKTKAVFYEFDEDGEAGPYTSPLSQLNLSSCVPVTTQIIPLIHSEMLKLT